MSIFEKRFEVILEQDDLQGIEPAPPVPEEDTDAGLDLSQSLAQDTPDNPAINYKKQQTEQQIATIEGWLSKIQEFTQFLNGIEDGQSIQAQLNNADCDTLFNSVSKSETKKISRIAQDLSGLIESLKGYLLSNSEDN